MEKTPLGSQVWATLSAHCLLPGLHEPPHLPSAMLQTKGQGGPGSQVPIGLQVSEVLFAPQRLLPGMQVPPQLPLEQTLGQVIPLAYLPSWSQVSMVRLSAPPQREVPGLQSPPHSPWPMQALSQAAAAGIHSPWSLQVSGSWSAPQRFCPAMHGPAQAPLAHPPGQETFIIQVPSAVQTSTALPLAAQRVAPAKQGPVPDGTPVWELASPVLPLVPVDPTPLGPVPPMPPAPMLAAPPLAPEPAAIDSVRGVVQPRPAASARSKTRPIPFA
jgi:hypothetical protein